MMGTAVGTSYRAAILPEGDMRIDLGRRGDYAIRAGVLLARERGRLVKSQEVAATMDIPQRFVHHVLADLVRAGLARSTPGPHGGYELAREPEAISVLEVVEATEAEVRATVCPLRGGPCRWDDSCALHPTWARAQQALLDELATGNLAALAAADADLERAQQTSAAEPHAPRAAREP